MIKPLDRLIHRESGDVLGQQNSTREVVLEENAVIDVTNKASETVVTVSAVAKQRVVNSLSDLFAAPSEIKTEEVDQDIGTGFVVDKGMVVTNKHVVGSGNVTYKIVDKDGREYSVSRIYRDPVNDLAILQVEELDLPVATLGDSDSVQVGQYVIAIGTALGEFRHTVTTGVVSGLGRGISAGDPLEGYVEQLDGVIQTDAAINPGNSGGPLLDYEGSVVGVNVAVAGDAQNIGFAIPINVVKKSLQNFKQTGEFDRAQLGVRYRMVSEEAAILNELPQGAYVIEVVAGSAADVGGIEVGDVITEIDGVKVAEVEDGLAEIINTKKIGDRVSLVIWRDGDELKMGVELKATVEN